jgi:circadian clock protein KaiC
MKEAARRGERSVVYSFEEETQIMLARAEAINIPARAMRDKGTLEIIKAEPLKHTPDEFARMVRNQVESLRTRLVMIDSITGYRLMLRGGDLVGHLHALCKYLQNLGVTLLLIVEIESLDEILATDVGISYLADNVLFLRYIEEHTAGRVLLRKAIGVLKKRASDFEPDLRMLDISRKGLEVSRAVPGLSNILGKTPILIPPEGEKH